MTATRTCDGCTECCDTHAVRAIGKPHHTPCEFCLLGVGCRVYTARNEDCQKLRCAYLDGHGSEQAWPHTSGIVQEETFNVFGRVWVLCESKEGALSSALAREEIIWALGEKMVVGLESITGECTYVIPAGKRVSYTARLMAGEAKARVVLEKQFFDELMT